jgi:hypothetical protein
MTLRDLLSTLRRLWSAVVSDQRSYGCLPEDTQGKIEKPSSSHPRSANSVEKDKPLR